MIKIERWPNGQYLVTKGDLSLVQTDIDGIKHNDCSVNHSDHNELVSSGDPRFRDLFVELSKFKQR